MTYGNESQLHKTPARVHANTRYAWVPLLESSLSSSSGTTHYTSAMALSTSAGSAGVAPTVMVSSKLKPNMLSGVPLVSLPVNWSALPFRTITALSSLSLPPT